MKKRRVIRVEGRGGGIKMDDFITIVLNFISFVVSMFILYIGFRMSFALIHFLEK